MRIVTIETSITTVGDALSYPKPPDMLFIGRDSRCEIKSVSGRALVTGPDADVYLNGSLVSEQRYAVRLGENSSISNTGYIIGQGGIFFEDGLFYKSSNIGTIISTDLDAAVYLKNADVFYFTNSGVISSKGVAFYSEAKSTKLFNSGSIDGEIKIKGATGLVANLGLVDGDVTFGRGDDGYDGRYGTVTGRVSGGDGDDRLLGGDAQDTLIGGAGRDILKGGDGDDVLISGKEGDVLNGGPGDDTFVFRGLHGGSVIRDFTLGDVIHLQNATFKKLGDEGDLDPDLLRLGAEAADQNDHIIYNPKSGTLKYDSNGDKAGGITLIAKIKGAPDPMHLDFEVI